jgi:hypothetical protein
LSDIITGKTAKFEMNAYNTLLNQVKAEAIALDNALKGK